MLKTQISPSCLQELLDATPNAGQKGLAQYFTPKAWAEVLAKPLPHFRGTIVDLTCGSGSLMLGVKNDTTQWRIGCELDPTHAGPGIINADLGLVHPLLHEVDWHADLFVLNPPFDHHWPRDRFPELLRSDCSSVAHAMAQHDGRTAKANIDSTITTLCIAIDRCSDFGEGFMIANESTLQRLIFAPNAPHRALAVHIWAHLTIDGNICTPTRSAPLGVPPLGGSEKVPARHEGYRTGVIYFAKGHTAGCRVHLHAGARIGDSLSPLPLLEEAKLKVREIFGERLGRKTGAQAEDYLHTEDTAKLWLGIREEWERRQGRGDGSSPSGKVPARHERHEHNIWLSPDGTIQTYLSVFDANVTTVDKGAAQILNSLNGKRPINLVVQKAQRVELEQAAFGGLWRVSQELQAAVKQAGRDYHGIRAPPAPLPEIQRLGYLDEQDTIVCRKDLFGVPPLGGSPPSTRPLFQSGRSYGLRTHSVKITRVGTKVNLSGGTDDMEYTGQELAILITDDAGVERLFMEARLKCPQVTIEGITKAGAPTDAPPDRGQLVPVPTLPVSESQSLKVSPIDFTLQQLCQHFTIPEVPDVATLRPAEFSNNISLLEQIETLCP